MLRTWFIKKIFEGILIMTSFFFATLLPLPQYFAVVWVLGCWISALLPSMTLNCHNLRSVTGDDEWFLDWSWASENKSHGVSCLTTTVLYLLVVLRTGFDYPLPRPPHPSSGHKCIARKSIHTIVKFSRFESLIRVTLPLSTASPPNFWLLSWSSWHHSTYTRYPAEYYTYKKRLTLVVFL